MSGKCERRVLSARFSLLLNRFVLILIPVFLISCIGTSSQIKLNANGSGTISQEIRVSRELMNMGKTEGNEEQFSLPLSREDVERTVERIPGTRLVSYNSREDGKDFIINVEFAFDSTEALAELMGTGDQQFVADARNRKITIHFPAGDYIGGGEPEGLIAAAFTGYEYSFSIAVPGPAKTAWFDEIGRSIQQYPGTCAVQNNTVQYTVSMGDLVGLGSPLNMEINW